MKVKIEFDTDVMDHSADTMTEALGLEDGFVQKALKVAKRMELLMLAGEEQSKSAYVEKILTSEDLEDAEKICMLVHM